MYSIGTGSKSWYREISATAPTMDSRCWSRFWSACPRHCCCTVTAFVISFVVGIPLGVYSATHKYSKGDYGLTVFSFIGISIPSFFFGMGLIYIFALKLDWLPTSGFGSATFRGTGMALVLQAEIPDYARHCNVLEQSGYGYAFCRSSMIETLNQDYIRTARPRDSQRRSSFTGMR